MQTVRRPILRYANITAGGVGLGKLGCTVRIGWWWEGGPVPRCSNQLLLSPSPSTFFATSCPAIHGGAYLSRLFVGENAIGYFFSRHTPLFRDAQKTSELEISICDQNFWLY